MIEATFAVGLGVVVGLVNLFKKVVPDKYRRYTPVLALVFGLGVAPLLPEALDLREVILTGLVLGLSGIGLYSGTKSVSGK